MALWNTQSGVLVDLEQGDNASKQLLNTEVNTLIHEHDIQSELSVGRFGVYK